MLWYCCMFRSGVFRRRNRFSRIVLGDGSLACILDDRMLCLLMWFVLLLTALVCLGMLFGLFVDAFNCV
jgi:hypothetical protein